jgi:hypothetical protein
MRVYALTKLGRKVASTHDGSSEELKVLQFLRDNKTATDDEIEINCGGRWTLRRLRERGLVVELTS